MQEFYLILHLFLLVFWANCTLSTYGHSIITLIGTMISLFGATIALQKLMRRNG